VERERERMRKRGREREREIEREGGGEREREREKAERVTRAALFGTRPWKRIANPWVDGGAPRRIKPTLVLFIVQQSRGNCNGRTVWQ